MISGIPSPEKARWFIPPKDLFEFVVRFAKTPRQTWCDLETDGRSFTQLYEQYAFFLATIPPVAGLIGGVVFRKASIVSSLLYSCSGYLMGLFFLFGATHLAQRTSKLFGEPLSLNAAGRLVIFSFVPMFVAGVFLLIPPISILALSGLSSFYLFYLGISVLTRIEKDKRLPYFLINVVTWIVVSSFLLDSVFT